MIEDIEMQQDEIEENTFCAVITIVVITIFFILIALAFILL